MIKLVIILQLFFGVSPKSGFKEIDKENYSKALQNFDKSIDKHKDVAAAYYGKALVLSNSKFAQYNFDSAYYFVRKGEDLFYDLTKEDQDKLNKLYKLSFSKYTYLRRNISFDALQAVEKKDILALQAFIDVFHDENTAKRAQEYIDEILIFSKIPLDKDISFYEMLIEKYPANDSIDKIWEIYYDMFTSDGSLLNMVRFKMNNPDFPFEDLFEKDYKIAEIAEKYKLLEGKTHLNANKYNDYIRAAAPKIQAYRAMLIFLKDYIDRKKWSQLNIRIKEYADVFGGNKMYNDLTEMVSAKSSAITPQSLSNNINTAGHEFSPVINATSDRIYFGGLGRTDNLGGEDIFYADFTDGEWQHAKLADGINSKYGNEAPDAISVDETRLLMFANGDVYVSTITPDGWSEPVIFPEINTRAWEGDAMLTADGNALIFASENWEKKGIQYAYQNRKDAFDIYVSIRSKDNKWSKPINLGTTVNSPYCDRYPFLHPDMKTLYFSSEGHGGFGGTDVYKCVRLNDSSWTEWSEPVNLGKNINTSGNDNGYKISTDGTMAYFSIKKKDIDIYSILLPDELRPDPVAIVEGTVTDESGNPLDATIHVEDLETGESWGEYYSHPKTGEYTMTLPLGKRYGYYVTKKFYFPVSKNLDLTSKDAKNRFTQNFVISSFKTITESNSAIRINNIFFDTDKFDLKPESYAELNRLAEIIKGNGSFRYNIEGHTDNIGNAGYNISLSQNRADAVMQYLVSQGCAQNQLSATGYGQQQPVDDNSTEQGRAANRRVEIRIEKK